MVIQEINLGDYIYDIGLNAQEIEEITKLTVQQITNKIKKNIVEKASNELFRTKSNYIKNVNTQFSNDGLKGYIFLANKKALMIEEGLSPFDMKTGFANSEKAKRTETNKEKLQKKGKQKWMEKGWHLTIPFRLGVPESIGEEFSGNLNDSIYNIALRDLEKKVSQRAENTKTGESFIKNKYSGIGINQLANLNKGYEIPSINRRDKWTSPAPPIYTHKSAMFEGVTKIEEVYKKTVQSTYLKFRRVSSNSDPNSWMHPGIKAHKYFDKVMQEIDFDQETSNYIDKVLLQLGFIE